VGVVADNEDEMSKHTPKPWSLDGLTVYALHDPNGEGMRNRFTAHVSPSNYGPYKIRAEELEANARLIAAAPEMFELLNWLNSRGGLGLDVHGYIDKVIRKAEEGR
jgi:hypothetical protein